MLQCHKVCVPQYNNATIPFSELVSVGMFLVVRHGVVFCPPSRVAVYATVCCMHVGCLVHVARTTKCFTVAGVRWAHISFSCATTGGD